MIYIRDLISADAALPTNPGHYLTIIADMSGENSEWWITEWTGKRWDLANHIVVRWKPLAELR